MPEESKDVEIGAKGITLRGAYEDFRPAVKRTVAIADNVLQVLENVIGLPADFVNHHLGRFRQHYKERLDSVPEEHQQQPPFRIGCGVLKEVAYAAEEPDLQELFAELLATASDDRRVNDAHPGFANIINQLTPFDAQLLKCVTHQYEPGLPLPSFTYFSLEHLFQGSDRRTIYATVDNLVRLGLIEWSIKGVRDMDLFSFRSDLRSYPSGSSYDTVRRSDLSAIDKKIERMSELMERMLKDIGEKATFRATVFGRQFARSCMQPSTELPASQIPVSEVQDNA